MRFNQKVTLVGVKSSKGTFEGTSFDSTKFFLLMDLDTRKGDAMGQSSDSFSMGTSAEFSKWGHLANSLPIQCDAEFDMVAGKQPVLLSLVPVQQKKVA